MSLWPMPALSDLTGIRAIVEESEIDLNFEDGQREARITRLGIEIEQKLQTGSYLGGSFGYLIDVNLRGDSDSESRGFDGEYLEVFLHHPFSVTDNLTFLTRLDYRYNSGNDNDEDDPAEVDWSEVGLQFGLRYRFSHFRLTPYARYNYLDGDVDADSGNESFDIDDPVTGGIHLDYFTEETSFVRLSLESGGYSGFYLTFAAQY